MPSAVNKSLLARYYEFEQTLASCLLPLALLVLRGYVAYQFMLAGWLKAQNWAGTLSLFREEYQVPVLPPELAAYLATAGELGFAVLLILGLLARPAAAALFAINLVAVISYPQLREFTCPAAINDHFYWGLLLLLSAILGPGKLALDRWLMRQSGSRTGV